MAGHGSNHPRILREDCSNIFGIVVVKIVTNVNRVVTVYQALF